MTTTLAAVALAVALAAAALSVLAFLRSTDAHERVMEWVESWRTSVDDLRMTAVTANARSHGAHRTNRVQDDRITALEARTFALENPPVPVEAETLLDRLDALWRVLVPTQGRRAVTSDNHDAPGVVIDMDDRRRQRLIVSLLRDGMTVEDIVNALGLSWDSIADDVLFVWKSLGDDSHDLTDAEAYAVRLAGLHVTTRRARLAREKASHHLALVPLTDPYIPAAGWDTLGAEDAATDGTDPL